MRSVIRPALVGFAVIGMSLAGAASAQACDKPSNNTDLHVVNFEDSFNETNYTNSFNNSVFFGDADFSS